MQEPIPKAKAELIGLIDQSDINRNIERAVSIGDVNAPKRRILVIDPDLSTVSASGFC